MSESITLKSGRELVINIADFKAACRLRRTIANELRGVKLEIDKLDPNMDIAKLGRDEINTFKDIICQLLGSEAVERCFFECATRCTIDKAAIRLDTFESEDARPDFLPVAQEVIIFNLKLFFVNLDLKSLVSAVPTSSDPASK